MFWNVYGRCKHMISKLPKWRSCDCRAVSDVLKNHKILIKMSRNCPLCQPMSVGWQSSEQVPWRWILAPLPCLTRFYSLLWEWGQLSAYGIQLCRFPSPQRFVVDRLTYWSNHPTRMWLSVALWSWCHVAVSCLFRTMEKWQRGK